MTISENLLMFVSGFGVLQGILLGGLLYFHPRSDRSVTTFLALYITCFCLPMLAPIVQQTISWRSMIFLDPFPLLAGPLLYLYVRSYKETITWRKAWPHFILFFIYVGLAFLLFYSFSRRFPGGYQVPEAVLHHPASITRVSVRIIQILAYYFVARRELSSYQRSIHQLFSETSKIDLEWVRLLINGYLILVLVMIANYSLMLRFPDNFSLYMLINTALATPYIYLAAFKGLTQPSIWQVQSGIGKEKLEEEIREVQEIESNNNNERSKELKTGLSKDKIDEIVIKTVGLMEREKLYQETDLTLQNLADKLQVPSYIVSQAINDGMKKNFYDLINSYRVEEAKRLLLDPKNKNYKILSVGFDAGFNSKTTFNTVFKKFTGLSPSDFRERQNTTAPAMSN